MSSSVRSYSNMSLAEFDARVTAAAEDATIFRGRTRPRYLFQPAEIGDEELAASVGVEFSSALEDPILVHSPSNL